MQVKMVNDTDRLIYAFEMLPMPNVETLVEDVVNLQKMPEVSSAISMANNASSSAAVSYTSRSSPRGTLDVLDDIVMSYLTGSDAPVVDAPVDNVLNNSIEPSVMSAAANESVVTHLESNPDVDWQHNVLNDASIASAVASEHAWSSSKQDHLLSAGTLWQDENVNSSGMKTTGDSDLLHFSGTNGNWSNDVDGGFSFSGENLDSLGEFHNGSSSDAMKTVSSDSATSPDVLGVEKEDEPANACLADQWKSCVICLEEMADSELKAHASCGGTLCHNCLDVSVILYSKYLVAQIDFSVDQSRGLLNMMLPVLFWCIKNFVCYD
jgi:hypothetical protein